MSRTLAQGQTPARALSGDAGAFSAATLVGVMFMGSTLLTPLYALYRREFGFSIVVLTLLYSVYVVGNLCALLFLGGLSDQIGRRKVALGSIAVAGLSTVMFFFAPNPVWLFLARAVSGLSIGVAAGTGTAWLAELIDGGHRARASTIATTANFLGVAAGPLLSGVLAQYAPWPTRLSFVVYFVVVALTAVLMARTAETVERKPGKPNLKPRIGVPPELRVRFIPPAVSVFGVMALVGFYAALVPSIMIRELHQTNLALGGAVAAAMFFIAAVVIMLTQALKPRTAMLWGLGLMPPAVGLLVLAQAEKSMPLLLVGALISGSAAALGYRGSLQVIYALAPADRRAEIGSAYYLCGFAGNALPVIGVGVVTALASAVAGSAAFAALIAVFAVTALAIELRRKPEADARPRANEAR
jgi:MFS family permease